MVMIFTQFLCVDNCFFFNAPEIEDLVDIPVAICSIVCLSIWSICLLNCLQRYLEIC